MRYINELKPDERIVEHFLCKEKQSLKSRNGKTYMSLKLQDKTGTIDAKVWELNNEIQSFEVNDYIKIDGTVLLYQNSNQIKIGRIRKSEEGEYDPSDYIPSTDKNVDVLYQKVLELIDTISNKYIKQLLANVFIKNEGIVKAFKSHSAGKSMHHSYMGGLVEHTLSVASICDFLCTHYDFLDRDVLLCGALLHDIAKIYELSPFPENEYTDEGQLIGHLVLGAELIEKESAKIDGMPQNLKNLLKHLILSHHGEYEYGSPQRPKLVEAYVLHCVDDMDAKTCAFNDALGNNSTNGQWLGYSRIFQGNIRKTVYDE